MKNTDNPYYAGRDPTTVNGASRRKRLNKIEIVVSLAILFSIFILASPAMYSGNHAGPTPDWMRQYIVPLSASIYQWSASAILLLAFCFIGIGMLMTWIQPQLNADANGDVNRTLVPEQTPITACDDTISEKSTNHLLARSEESAAS
jgi:hypothetical protein